MITSFKCSTLEDGKVLDFSRDIRQGLLLITLEVPPYWMDMTESKAPSMEELT